MVRLCRDIKSDHIFVSEYGAVSSTWPITCHGFLRPQKEASLFSFVPWIMTRRGKKTDQLHNSQFLSAFSHFPPSETQAKIIPNYNILKEVTHGESTSAHIASKQMHMEGYLAPGQHHPLHSHNMWCVCDWCSLLSNSTPIPSISLSYSIVMSNLALIRRSIEVNCSLRMCI